MVLLLYLQHTTIWQAKTNLLVLKRGARSISGLGKEVKEKFYSNFEKYNGDIDKSQATIAIIEANFFNLNLFESFQSANLKSVNCYFYDADHSENATWWGLTVAYPVLADYFVYIADDWNDQDVRKGALGAIKDLGFSVHRHYQF